MNYRKMTLQDMPEVVEKYVDYYNNEEECCWTVEKAGRRIHQVLAMEGSLCLLQCDDDGVLCGFAMGYLKEFDDITGYYLEEIVIFRGFQNRGYGTELMQHLEQAVKEHGAVHIDLSSVNDDMHRHFYSKLGYYATENFSMMGKFF